MKLNMIILSILFVFISCAPANQIESKKAGADGDAPQPQSDSIAAPKRPKKLIKSCFRNVPKWVTSKNAINGNIISHVEINVDSEEVFSQLKRPSAKQIDKLKQKCPNGYQLIDYYWFGETKITKLYGLCIEQTPSGVQFLY
ncbi:MAG: hypothetical protein OMM_07057 [Candidatus Magnetoglobus multicellularis str. Araruama]|uniref:Lipoprotein n=1 Tax=Candidatus Magnetoglobus multicellularis str. Araruama TaxID=890399 RepID=A0A1V1PEE2_9BACT|nr:MAG: hypothetical protein OMM_07057 [Candidatus Magnetoglobus multicellularis str. Araruama]